MHEGHYAAVADCVGSRLPLVRTQVDTILEFVMEITPRIEGHLNQANPRDADTRESRWAFGWATTRGDAGRCADAGIGAACDPAARSPIARGVTCKTASRLAAARRP